MTQVSKNFAVGVKSNAPPPPPPPPGGPLRIDSVSPDGVAPGETETIQANDLIGIVRGGMLPYTINATGLPPGVSLLKSQAGDGSVGVSLSGKPSAGDGASSPYAITLTVTDSAH